MELCLLSNEEIKVIFGRTVNKEFFKMLFRRRLKDGGHMKHDKFLGLIRESGSKPHQLTYSAVQPIECILLDDTQHNEPDRAIEGE